jgi:FkbM family methyltransferase
MGVLSKVQTALGWRSRLLLDKAQGQLGMVPWSIVWEEVKARRELECQVPEFIPIGADEAAGLTELSAGSERYWIPEGIYGGGLTAIYKEVFNPDHPHHYEYRECRIRPNDVVVDAGACEGFFVRFALQKGARVVAIEPYSRMAEALRRTFAAEIQEGRVIVIQALLTDRVGETTLALNPMFPFEAHAAKEQEAAAFSEAAVETTLDALVDSLPWKRCDFLKMDIEGAERGAVAGAAETLKRDRPCLSLAVYHLASGYRDIAGDIRRLGLGYQVEGKGLQEMGDNIRRPMMLHAWAPRGAAAGR